MLNKLLSMTRQDRHAYLINLTAYMRREFFNNIPTLTKTLRLNEVGSYEKRVNLRHKHIQQYPDGVFWDYAELCTTENEFVTYDFILVSTRGDVVQLDENRRYPLFISPSKHTRHRAVNVPEGRILISRIVGSTFIPRPKNLKRHDFSKLHVLGTKGETTNYNVNLLRWGLVRNEPTSAYWTAKTSLMDSINELLAIPDKKARTAQQRILQRRNLFRPFECITTLTEILALDKVDSYKERVRLRHQYILSRPNERHWDYAEYQHGSLNKHEIDKTMLVSTYGDVINTSTNGHIRVVPSTENRKTKLKHNAFKGTILPTHRIMASTFVPKENRVEMVPYNKLSVKHKNRDILNNAYWNLEWVIGRSAYAREKYDADGPLE